MAAPSIPTDTYKLGFIGAGKMAESIARGVVKSGTLPAYRIQTAHSRLERRGAFQSFGVSVVDHNHQVVEASDVVVLSVKPQTVKRVALELRPLLQDRHLLVSVVAGVKLKDLQMSLMNAKSQKSIYRKPVSFIAPGRLAKERGYGKNTSNVSYGSKRITGEKNTDNLCNQEMAGENPVHNLFVHYGEDKWEERNITEDSSFLDVLSICNRFIDVYSFGIKITDAKGRPLTNDKDLLGLLKEQANVKNISIYLDKDTTMKPLNFKLPQDNPSFVSVSRASQVEDVLTDDSDSSEMNHHSSEKNVEDSTKNVRKVRGANKNKKLVALKKGEKLEIQFFQDRAIGPNHQYWSRHLAKIVRNKHVCPIRVHTWKDITESDKQHMWDMAKEKFYNPGMEEYREHTLEHMDTLWTSWRSTLNKNYIKPCKTKVLALKNVPRGMDAKDWEWLVTEKYLIFSIEQPLNNL